MDGWVVESYVILDLFFHVTCRTILNYPIPSHPNRYFLFYSNLYFILFCVRSSSFGLSQLLFYFHPFSSKSSSSFIKGVLSIRLPLWWKIYFYHCAYVRTYVPWERLVRLERLWAASSEHAPVERREEKRRGERGWERWEEKRRGERGREVAGWKWGRKVKSDEWRRRYGMGTRRDKKGKVKGSA